MNSESRPGSSVVPPQRRSIPRFSIEPASSTRSSTLLLNAAPVAFAEPTNTRAWRPISNANTFACSPTNGRPGSRADSRSSALPRSVELPSSNAKVEPTRPSVTGSSRSSDSGLLTSVSTDAGHTLLKKSLPRNGEMIRLLSTSTGRHDGAGARPRTWSRMSSTWCGSANVAALTAADSDSTRCTWSGAGDAAAMRPSKRLPRPARSTPPAPDDSSRRTSVSQLASKVRLRLAISARSRCSPEPSSASYRSTHALGWTTPPSGARTGTTDRSRKANTRRDGGSAISPT